MPGLQNRDPSPTPMQVVLMAIVAGAFGAGVGLYPPLLRLAEIGLVIVCVVSALYVYARRQRELD